MSSQIGDDMKNTKYHISLGVDYTVVTKYTEKYQMES